MLPNVGGQKKDRVPLRSIKEQASVLATIKEYGPPMCHHLLAELKILVKLNNDL